MSLPCCREAKANFDQQSRLLSVQLPSTGLTAPICNVTPGANPLDTEGHLTLTFTEDGWLVPSGPSPTGFLVALVPQNMTNYWQLALNRGKTVFLGISGCKLDKKQDAASERWLEGM